ncbi:hypothetical protein M0D21_13605 [Aquimarina sp. D1M17]|uniref:tetratricopeptide repeat protein n=1 Tax=Aquimarina acroporae TaxID=2937283 RepID=UPI0020BDA0AA|nr:tetratricopeptide repeat protein [Aquimarina acroporae]MCK8522615.1 hypothetical protein [Aquimarina acroporae]
MEKETLIIKYFEGSLTQEELKLFEQYRKEDTSFEQEVLFQEDAQKVLKAEEKANIKSLFNQYEEEITNNSSSKAKNKSKFWLVAASLAILIGSAVWFSLQTSAVSSEELYANYFQPYKNVVHPLTRSVQEKDQKTIAFEAYENGDYDTAAHLFNQLFSSSKEPYYLFYAANSLMQLNKMDDAIPLLEKHLTTQDTLNEKSVWYLALAYLRKNNIKEAKTYLNLIITEKKYNHKKAKELLDSL